MLCSDKAMMDWYHELDTEEFVVPKDEELLDRFPSPDSWQQWGQTQTQNFGWNMRFDPVKKPDLPDDKNNQKAEFAKSNGQISSIHDESEGQDNDFSMHSGWPSDSWCEDSMVQDRPDFQFNDLMRNDQMDDIFLSSLLKEDPPATENADANDDSESLMYDLQSVSGAIPSKESSQNFKTSNVSNSTSMTLSDRHMSKACESNVVHPSYKRTSNGQNGSSGSGCTGEEVSLEESVLNDLGVTLTQLSKNTRLCFRDSLYRLAQNSTKQTLLSGQVKDPAQYELSEMEVDDERARSGETGPAESETNTIDRAVANFVFKKMDVNTQDLHPSMSSSKRKCEDDETKGTKYISFSQPEIFDYPST